MVHLVTKLRLHTVASWYAMQRLHPIRWPLWTRRPYPMAAAILTQVSAFVLRTQKEAGRSTFYYVAGPSDARLRTDSE
jgi:hypothetical protein